MSLGVKGFQIAVVQGRVLLFIYTASIVLHVHKEITTIMIKGRKNNVMSL